jgi:hypothetical protein
MLVDLDAEGLRDLLCDAHATELRVAHLHLDDCANEFRGGSFRTGLTAMACRREENPVFAIDQCLVELEIGWSV